MLLTITAAMYRHIHIRSAKGFALAMAAVLAMYVMQTFFEERLGWSTKKAQGAAGAILFVLAVIILIIAIAARS